MDGPQEDERIEQVWGFTGTRTKPKYDFRIWPTEIFSYHVKFPRCDQGHASSFLLTATGSDLENADYVRNAVRLSL